MTKPLSIQVITNSSNDTWVNFLNKYRYSEKYSDISKIILDFKDTRFLEPYHIVSLSCLIEEYFQNGIAIEFIPGKYNVDKYLLNIRFYDYWKEGFDRGAFTNVFINTTLCLWHISKEMIYNYATYAQQYFQDNYFNGSKSLDALHQCLSEIFNNIYDHSESQYDGYVLTQYYPNLNLLRTSICDFGVGIPTKINRYWQSQSKDGLADEDALRIAFIRNVSSKSTPHNKGFGLANLLSSVLKFNGRLDVYSNWGQIAAHSSLGGLKSYRGNKHFKGTLVSLSFNTNHLPEFEETNDSDVFHF